MKTDNKNIDNLHKDELGFGLPDNYFEKSKSKILSKISENKEVQIIPLYKRKTTWLVAAGIALLISVSVYKQQISNSVKNVPEIALENTIQTKHLELAADYIAEENMLLASILVSDKNVDTYLNNAFINSVLEDEHLDNFIVDELMDEELY